MRKVTFGVANSLDNYITGPDDSIDWLAWSDDVTAIMKDYMARVDAILMGRKTWEFAVKAGGGGGGGKSKVRTYVFSSTLEEAPEGAELVREDAAGFVRKLKQEAGGEICVMGGGALAAALL